MIKTLLKTAAIALVLAPAVAAAQSAISDPAVPGSGYKVPNDARTSAQPSAAYPVDPSVPGDGYKIEATPRTDPNPPAADVQNPGTPGDGYQIRTQTERAATDSD